MSKKIFSIFFCIFIITIICSCSRSSITIVYLNVNKVVVYDSLSSACSSGQSIGKSITEIIPNLGKSFVSYKDETICLKARIRKEKLITSHGVSNTIIEVYEIPETNYFLRLAK